MAAHTELTVSSADSWGNSCCLVPGVAPVPVFGSAGRSFQRTRQRRDHKRFLRPSPEAAHPPGQQLSPDCVPGAPARQLSILLSILFPAGPCTSPAAAAAALSEPRAPRSTLSLPSPHPLPPPSAPTRREGGSGSWNSPVEITDSSVFTR